MQREICCREIAGAWSVLRPVEEVSIFLGDAILEHLFLTWVYNLFLNLLSVAIYNC